MTPDTRKQFEKLAIQRSPENLSCDGELSRSAIIKRHAAIMAEWQALEKQVGRKVSLDEIYIGMGCIER